MNDVLELPSHIRFLLTLALSAATFLFVLDYSIANVSIPYIAGNLAISTDEGIYVITSFAVGNAIALPMTGWLSLRIGKVKLLCLSILLFTLFSWSCGFSVDLQMLVLSRFLQGLASGPLIPLSQTLLLMIYPVQERPKALALWSTIVITAPIAGPMLGGWISYDYTWPWIFYINIPVGLISAAILWAFLKPYDTSTEKVPIDVVGLIFLALGVCSLQFLLDKGQQYDWLSSNLILSCAITCIVSFTFLIVWSLTTKNPLIKLRLFKTRTFALAVFYIAIIYSIYFGSVVLMPLWLQTCMNYTAIWAGLAVAPIGIIPLTLGIFMAALLKHFGIIRMLASSFIGFAISCFYTAYFNTDVDFFHIAFSRFLLGIGLGGFITPLFSLSVTGIAEEDLPSSTGLFHFVRGLSGGIGTSIFTTLWTRRGYFHHARLGESVTTSSAQTHHYLSELDSLGLAQAKGLESLNDTLTLQAQMLAINDCFLLMGWLFIALLFFLPFARSKNREAHKMPPSIE